MFFWYSQVCNKVFTNGCGSVTKACILCELLLFIWWLCKDEILVKRLLFFVLKEEKLGTLQRVGLQIVQT